MKKETEKTETAGMASKLNGVLCTLDRWEEFAKERRDEQDKLKKVSPIEAKIEGLVATNCEEIIGEIRAVIGELA